MDKEAHFSQIFCTLNSVERRELLFFLKSGSQRLYGKTQGSILSLTFLKHINISFITMSKYEIVIAIR